MDIQRTIYAVTIKSHDSLFERIYHVISDCALNAGEKAKILGEKEYKLSDLYIEKSPVVCYLDGLIESSGEAEVGEEEGKLRELLWLNHGCPHLALYGDDGERQCGNCRIDFKRSSAKNIERMLVKSRQPRTVSREQFRKWAEKFETVDDEALLYGVLDELGYEIKEKGE